MDSSTSFDPLVGFTLFAAPNMPHGERREVSLSELVASLREHPTPRATPKDSAPGWSPATFAGDRRFRAGIEHVHLVGFDLDEGLPAALDACGRLGFRHTTSRHTPAAPRARLFLALSRAVTADEYDVVFTCLARDLGLTPDDNAKDASRFWFAPHEPADGTPFELVEIPGEPVDVDAILRDAPPVVASAPVVLGEGLDVGPDALRAAAELVAPHFKDGVRDRLGFALACAVLRMGLSAASTTALVTLVDELGPAPDKHPEKRPGETERAARRLAGEGGNATGVTTLRDVTGDNEIGRKLERALGLAPDAARILERMQGTSALPSAPTWAPANDTQALEVEWIESDYVPEDPEFIVEGVRLQAGAVSMLYADSTAGKSWVALSLAAAVTDGEKWLGRFATKKRKALYVSFELGKDALARRRAILGSQTRIGLCAFPKLHVNEAPFWDALVTTGAQFVIVDTLGSAAQFYRQAVDENSPLAAAPISFARKFANATGAHVMFVHHTGKSPGSGPRGSSAFRANVDDLLTLEVKDDGKITGERVFLVNSEKCMNGELFPSLQVAFHKSRGLYLLEKEHHALEGPTHEERVLTVLRKGPQGSKEKIAREAKLNTSEGGKAIDRLCGRGFAVKLDGKYQIDTPDAQRARVVAVVEGPPVRFTPSSLAKEAHVPPDVVERGRAEGWLIPDHCYPSKGHWAVLAPIAV